MKKLFLGWILLAMTLCLAACAGEVYLKCDTEGCENTVAAVEEADEDWVVFCEECKK